MRLAFDPPTDPAAYPFSHEIRVRFAETDAMGIVHHAAYLPYLEETRVAYLDAIGHPYLAVRGRGSTSRCWRRTCATWHPCASTTGSGCT